MLEHTTGVSHRLVYRRTFVTGFSICRFAQEGRGPEAIIESGGYSRTPLKTATASAVQPAASGHIQGLIKSLVKSLDRLPDETNTVERSEELPPALQKVVTAAMSLGHSWAAWCDSGAHVWLYVGNLSRLLSRKRGSPVLQVKHYRETGLVDTCNWVIDRNAKWCRWDE